MTRSFGFSLSLWVWTRILEEVQLSAFTVSLAVFCLLPVQYAHGNPAPNIPASSAADPQKVACGRDLYLSIPPTWEVAPVSFPAIQCAFKRNGFGFPNVNVVVEPAPRAESESSSDRMIQGILESYRSVGLQNVGVLGPLPLPTLPRNGAPSQTISFAITLEYTGSQGTMLSSVGFLDAGDRRFVITYLDKKGDSEQYVQEAGETVHSLVLSEEGLKGLPAARQHLSGRQGETLTEAAFSPSGAFTLLLGAALILGAIVALIKMRQQ